MLRRASGAQFLIARGRGSGRRSTAPTTRAVARPAAGCAAAVDSLAPDVAAASEGVLLRCSAFLHQRAAASGAAFYHLDVFAGTSVGLASVARLLYALVAPGLAYIRCVEKCGMIRDPCSSCL